MDLIFEHDIFKFSANILNYLMQYLPFSLLVASNVSKIMYTTNIKINVFMFWATFNSSVKMSEDFHLEN